MLGGVFAGVLIDRSRDKSRLIVSVLRLYLCIVPALFFEIEIHKPYIVTIAMILWECMFAALNVLVLAVVGSNFREKIQLFFIYQISRKTTEV